MPDQELLTLKMLAIFEGDGKSQVISILFAIL